MSTTTRVVYCTLVALLVSAVAGRAQGTRGTISGVVVGPAGAPQPNVTLVLTNAAGIDRRGVSEADGQFVFGGLQPGTYRLRTEDETFAPFSQDQIVAAGQTLTIRIALQSRVPVAPAPTARATVQGTVIGPEGRPLANTTVILTNPQGVDRRAVSEPTGNYIFGGLQPGTYRLRIEDPGPGALPFPPADLPLGPGEQRQFDVRIQPVPPPPPPPPTVTPPLGAQPQPPPSVPPPQEGGQVSVARKQPAETVPKVTADNGEFEAAPDRWRFKWPVYERYSPSEKMPWVIGSPLDPYNQNAAKADYPIGSSGVFANLNLQLNSALNPREVGNGAAQDQIFYNNNLVGGLEIFKGDTVFQPKSWALRATAVANFNGTNQGAFSLSDAVSRTKYGLEEAFAEKRLAVISPAFDFVSIRAGMQNFNSDFRGYVFVDNQLGARLFGNARSNRDQYNVVYFSMRNRDQFSQLHDFTSRNQDVVIANYYIQDFGAQGYTAMFNVHVNHDNGTALDPTALQATYLGFHGDGKWGSWAVSHAFYEVFGKDDNNAIARTLNKGAVSPVDINAQMAAIELSRDSDWLRYRISGFYASGDDRSDPTKAKGFDAITDNPNLAGGQFMYWTQQKTAIAGLPVLDKQVGAILSEKFSLLPDLRSKFTDRSNFVNPGLMLANAGVDMRVSPQLKIVTNVSYLQFANAAVLQQLMALQKHPGFEDNTIGWDIGAGAKLRPFVNENLFFVLGFSTLIPRGGFATALGSDSRLFSVVGAIQMAY